MYRPSAPPAAFFRRFLDRVATARGYSARRYLHMEAVFVFESRLDHLCVALTGGSNSVRLEDLINTEKGMPT
jgi:hypothetical protein